MAPVVSLGSQNVEIHSLTELSELNVHDHGVFPPVQDTTIFRVHPHSVNDARISPNGGKVKHHAGRTRVSGATG